MLRSTGIMLSGVGLGSMPPDVLSACAARRCHGCSPWWPTVTCSCAPTPGRWPRSSRCGPPPNRRGPELSALDCPRAVTMQIEWRQPISGTADGADELTVFGVMAEFLAQPSYMDGNGIGVCGMAPDGPTDLVATGDASVALDEVNEQLEFPLGQFERLGLGRGSRNPPGPLRLGRPYRSFDHAAADDVR